MASSRFVRASKFRHVFGEPWNTDTNHLDLDLSTTTGDHNYIQVNPKFFAVAARGGGGPVLVKKLDDAGKTPRGAPTICGHSASVLDTAWNPFNDHLLATGSDDATVKVWQIPEEGVTEKLTAPLVDLRGAAKSVTLLQFNPVANNVLAAASKDQTVRLWDVEKQEAKVVLDKFEGLLSDMQWNWTGTQLVTTSKEKACRVWDVRANTVAQQWQPHDGGKPFKALFQGRKDNVITLGFTKQSKREIKMFDPRNTAEPVWHKEMDQASGVLMPFYDEDTGILYVTGKGDGNIRYYELVDESPYIYGISELSSSVSTKGIAMMPKRGLDVGRCEVARFVRLLKDSTETISFIVPRKDESFQADLFPDAIAGIPALDSEAWFSGKDAEPKTMSMDPAKNGGATASRAAAFKPVAKAPAPAPAPVAGGGGGGGGSSDAAAGGKSVEELTAALAKAELRIAELEKENAALKAGKA